tara:strand:+ start:9544 stop:10401 length:858 start_codon:yes stop_codon:yes gene_type:complete
MKFDPKDVHIVLIGNDRVKDYILNLELMRYNYEYGLDLWITTVFNGDQNELSSGIGENTFIYLPKNNGYGYGALDGFNEGLRFAAAGYRPYVAIFNFDVWFLNDIGFKIAMTEFIESGKLFAAGHHQSHKWCMTDCMFFKREFLQQLLPLEDNVLQSRKNNNWLQNEMNGTELGFMNMEEWFLWSVKRALALSDDPTSTESNEELNDVVLPLEESWHRLQRDNHPWYRWTDRYNLAHEHDFGIKKNYLLKYNQKEGHNITRFLGYEIPHTEIGGMKTGDGKVITI